MRFILLKYRETYWQNYHSIWRPICISPDWINVVNDTMSEEPLGPFRLPQYFCQIMQLVLFLFIAYINIYFLQKIIKSTLNIDIDSFSTPCQATHSRSQQIIGLVWKYSSFVLLLVLLPVAFFCQLSLNDSH